MRSAAVLLAVLCLVAAVYSLPAPAAADVEKDALEPKDDLKTDSSYGLGYAYPSLGYYGYGVPAYGYGYGLYGYDPLIMRCSAKLSTTSPSINPVTIGYPRYYYGYGYPAYYL